MLSFLHAFIPIMVMVVLAELAVRSARAFFAAERANAFVIVARVPSWLLAVILTAITVQFAFHVLPVQPGDPFNTWMAAAIMLTVVRIVLTWAYAAMLLGMNILMAVNYMRVPSGRRNGMALLIAGAGAVCLAAGTMMMSAQRSGTVSVAANIVGAAMIVLSRLLTQRTDGRNS